MSNRDDAEDIAQESWARIAAAVARDESRIGNFGAYLFRVARNLVVDHYRRQSTSPETNVDASELQAIADPRPSAESQLITHDELRRMDRIVAAMPARPREVFRLSRIEGLSFAEIARRLGISRQTVHEHMTRALLAIQLAADGQFDDRP